MVPITGRGLLRQKETTLGRRCLIGTGAVGTRCKDWWNGNVSAIQSDVGDSGDKFCRGWLFAIRVHHRTPIVFMRFSHHDAALNGLPSLMSPKSLARFGR